ncbi:MAG: CorA family divalent cation transporter [Alsobacter sp.]
MRAKPLPLADEHSRPGIVFAVSFDEDGRPADLPLTAMPDFGAPGVAFWWVHVNIVDKRGRDWIAALPDLPHEAKEVLVSPEAHDRIDIEDDTLSGVFVDLRLDFAQATEDMTQLRFALKPQLLVTARRHSLRSIEATRAALLGGRRAESALDLLETIVDREADVVASAATDLGHAVDAIEDKILEGHDRDAHDGIGAIRRRAVRLNRQLSRLLGLFRRVELAPALRLPQDVRDAAGRIAQRLESIHQEIHASQERARLLQDEVAAHMAAETNRQLYILSMLTAVFLPATLVTGIFGMNTKGLPFTEDDSGFWWACALGAAAAAIVFLGLLLVLRGRSGGL